MKKILILLTLFSVFLFANVAKVVALKGDAFITRENKEIKLTSQSIILKNDIIKTNDNTKLQIIFTDNTIITIGKNSQLNVNDYVYDEKNKEYKANFGLLKGTFRTITGKIGKISPDKFKLSSKTSSIGIRGTQILSNIEISGDTIFCTEGQIDIISRETGEKVTINAGEFVQLKEGQPIGEVKKFDKKTIDAADGDTKFVAGENKEEVLDSFGVEVVDTENEETPTTISQESEFNSNDTKKVDDIKSETEVDNDKRIGFLSSKAGVFGSIDKDKIALISKSGGLAFSVKDGVNNNFSQQSATYTNSLYAVTGATFRTSDGTSGSFISDSSYTLKEDTLDGSVAAFDSNDSIAWGTWNVQMNAEETINENGFWLSGDVTSVKEVNKLISAGGTVNYSGYLLGYSQGGTDLSPANNSTVTFAFDFGASTFTGNFKFASGSSGLGVSGKVTSTGFTFTQNTDTSYGGNGKFYGKHGSSVGGNFKLNESGYDYAGVFKATKTD